MSSRRLYILSDAGKPIWTSTDEDEVALAPLMGLTTAVVGFAESSGGGWGDSSSSNATGGGGGGGGRGPDRVRCVVAGRSRMVFLTRGSIILLAVSPFGEAEAFLALLLEGLYQQVVLTLTAGVQRQLRDRRYDLRNLLGGTEQVLAGLAGTTATTTATTTASTPTPASQSSSSPPPTTATATATATTATATSNGSGANGSDALDTVSARRALSSRVLSDGALLCGGVRALAVEPAVRAAVGATLASLRRRCPDILYAVLLVGDRLLALLQPDSGGGGDTGDRKSSSSSSSSGGGGDNGGGGGGGGGFNVEVEGDPQFALHFLDLRLVVNFVCSKRAALQKQREIWMPLCLPRFNARVRTTTRFSKLTF
jgi:hypothetical protein